MTRAEKVAEAQRLRAEGLLLREIAERMGSKKTTVSNWLSDPDRAKALARREGYSGNCRSCGARTDGSNGRAHAPQRCWSCHKSHLHDSRRFTAEHILDCLADIEAYHGRPFTSNDLNPWMHRDEERKRAGIALVHERGWPHTDIVRREFGTVSAARAALARSREAIAA